MNAENAASPDMVAQEIEAVRARLARMRAAGEIPSFPENELGRQFDGVVESVEAGLLAEPEVDVDAVRRHAVFPPPTEPGTGILSRLARGVLRRAGGSTLRGLNAFAGADVSALDTLADRQRRMQDLVLHVQLERIRQLEYRVGELELEVERLRSSTPASGGGAASATAPGPDA